MAFAGREMAFPSEDGTLRGYLARPASGAGPGVVVIQEFWGLVDPIREVCDRLAREGFVAVAPDLYRGDTAREPDAAQRLMMDLEIPRAGRDLDAAVQALLDEDATEGPRVGCIGFCMGGQLALWAGTRNRRIGAVVDFYGIHPRVEPDLTQLEAPVLGIFAEKDPVVPPEAARKLESDLRSAGKRAKILVYPGVDHGFMNDARPDVYHAETAARAWGETLAFLRAELGG